jgi:PEP-CTERM motif
LVDVLGLQIAPTLVLASGPESVNEPKFHWRCGVVKAIQYSLLVLLFVALSVGSMSAANLVSNGSFSGCSSHTCAGWTFTPAASGSDFAWSDPYAEFGGVSAGSYDTISQGIADMNGGVYTLSFNLLNEDGTNAADFEALWNGVVVLDVPGTSAFALTNFTVNVTGTGSDTLAFAGYQVPSWYYLTDVSLTGAAATPEPASLFLLGSGLLGAAIRRRKLNR